VVKYFEQCKVDDRKREALRVFLGGKPLCLIKKVVMEKATHI
jgi:hypothetical protein